MNEDRQVKMMFLEFREWEKALRSCRSNHLERGKELRQIWRLLSGLAMGRKTTEVQESKTPSGGPGELAAGLKNAIAKEVPLMGVGYCSEVKFERELDEKTMPTILELEKDPFDLMKIGVSFADAIRIHEMMNELIKESRPHNLNLYNWGSEVMKDVVTSVEGGGRIKGP